MGFVDYTAEGHVGIITINRPKALNALNEDVLKDIEAAFDAVDLSEMEPSDVRMLNAYHKEVYEKLSPYMTEEENEWLKDATRAIGGGYTWTI